MSTVAGVTVDIYTSMCIFYTIDLSDETDHERPSV